MILSNLLRGEKVYLTTLTKDDADALSRWSYNTEYMRLADTDPARPSSPEQTAEGIAESHKKKDVFRFGIRLLEDDTLIGDEGVGNIEWPHGVGEIGIGIGEPEHWGKGYGREATWLLLRFCFWELNLHRIQLTVFDYNPRAIAAYEKLGFVREGTFREFVLRDGERHDMFLYGLLRREWEAINAGDNGK